MKVEILFLFLTLSDFSFVNTNYINKAGLPLIKNAGKKNTDKTNMKNSLQKTTVKMAKKQSGRSTRMSTVRKMKTTIKMKKLSTFAIPKTSIQFSSTKKPCNIYNIYNIRDPCYGSRVESIVDHK